MDHRQPPDQTANVDAIAQQVREIRQALSRHVTRSQEQAKLFFKTNPGDYAEHDQFIGVSVPHLRQLAQIYARSELAVLKILLSAKINEQRLLALLILVGQYQRATKELKLRLYQFYLDNLHGVSNWNLVDASAHLIVGAQLWDGDRAILWDLVKSDRLWDRRVAIVATWYFIKKGDTAWTFMLADFLLTDQHELMHKAVGWMLREAGKQNEKELLAFLRRNGHRMPRTMLRYAIERLPQDIRLEFLSIRKTA